MYSCFYLWWCGAAVITRLSVQGRVIVAEPRHGFGSSWHQGHHGVRWHVSGDCHHRQHYHPPSHLFGNNWELNDCENGAKMCTSSVRQITINKHFRRAVNMSRLGSGTLHGQYNEHTGSFKPSDLEFKNIYALTFLLHLIYSHNSFKCEKDNIGVHRELCSNNTKINIWSKLFLDQYFDGLLVQASVWFNAGCWEWNWL